MEPPVPPEPSRREIDQSVLGILREEAERERRARKQEATTETFAEQAELGLDSAPQKPAPRTDMPDSGTGWNAQVDAPPVPPSQSKRERLPDIDQINSTLSASSDRVTDMAAWKRERDSRRSSFRSGFLGVVAIAAMVIAVYALAPQIAGLHPMLEPPMTAYVSVIDGARAWINETVPALVARLVDQLPATTGN
ncbi:MJ0042 family finger-like domain protein [Rhodovulum sp. P5]|nr:MJ0042 family finger-like domain protein [Rhodovulum sp. P5]